MLDLEEWAEVRNKMQMLHTNITDEAKGLVAEMMKSFNPELVVQAQKLSQDGQIVMAAMEVLAKLEAECAALQEKFQVIENRAGGCSEIIGQVGDV